MRACRRLLGHGGREEGRKAVYLPRHALVGRNLHLRWVRRWDLERGGRRLVILRWDLKARRHLFYDQKIDRPSISCVQLLITGPACRLPPERRGRVHARPPRNMSVTSWWCGWGVGVVCFMPASPTPSWQLHLSTACPSGCWFSWMSYISATPIPASIVLKTILNGSQFFFQQM